MSSTKVAIHVTDYDEIVAVIHEGYVEGLREGSFDKIMTSFHPDATMHGYSDGAFLTGPIRDLTAYIARYGSGPDMRARIDVLDITATTAVARIALERTPCNSSYTDFHSLSKINGKWTVMAKLFHEHES